MHPYRVHLYTQYKSELRGKYNSERTQIRCIYVPWSQVYFNVYSVHFLVLILQRLLQFITHLRSPPSIEYFGRYFGRPQKSKELSIEISAFYRKHHKKSLLNFPLPGTDKRQSFQSSQTSLQITIQNVNFFFRLEVLG